MTRSMRTVASRLLVLALIVLAACGGPEEPIAVGLKEFGTRVVLGEPDTDPIALPLPPDAVVVPSPGLGGLPIATDDLGPLPTTTIARAVDCPKAPLGAAPADEARTEVVAPPVEAGYAFRNDGEYSTSGATTISGRFPEQSTRRVHDVLRQDDGSFDFAVTSTVAESVTTTTYRVVPRGSSGAGLHVSRVQHSAGGRMSDFRPQPPLLLLPFPAVPGARWQTSGVDAVNHTAMAYSGTVRPNSRVDACGTMLDAIEVVIDGSVTDCTVQTPVPGPTTSLPTECSGAAVASSGTGSHRFQATYAIGTQFGGLILSDAVDATVVEPGTTTNQRNTATISARPATAS
jgi:hypothetical protein